MVSKASDDLPDPLKPVITVKVVARNLDVDVLEVVLPCPVHGNVLEQTPIFPHAVRHGLARLHVSNGPSRGGSVNTDKRRGVKFSWRFAGMKPRAG